MAVVFSDPAWADYRNNWPRMKREVLDTVDYRLRSSMQENQTGADFFPVPFRNDSNETIPAFAVMRVTGVATGMSIPLVTVAKPSSSFQRLYLVNGPIPVAGGSKSREMPGFGTWADQAGFVLYDDANTPAYGESWGPSDGSWEIKKWRYGFTILGGAASGIVGTIQHQVNHFWGQTQGALNKGSTGTIEIYDGNDADTTNTMAGVKNKYANVGDNKKVSVEWLGGSWYAKAAEC